MHAPGLKVLVNLLIDRLFCSFNRILQINKDENNTRSYLTAVMVLMAKIPFINLYYCMYSV